MSDPCYRKNITIGSLVKIEDEKSTLTTSIVTGKIKKILSNQKYSEDGIRVELENGKKGPVQSILRIEKSSDENVELLSGEERDDIEFKGSYAYKLDGSSKERFYPLECSVAKTIAGFANKFGGTLFIGVDDKKEDDGKRIIHGLENDYKLMGVDSDGFQIEFKNDMNAFFNNNKAIAKNIEYEPIRMEEHDILKITVTPSDTPYITYEEQRRENCPKIKIPKFYVRDGNGTAAPNAEEFIVYWLEHIKNK